MRWQEVDEGPVGGPHELASDENNKPIYWSKMVPDKLPADADPVTKQFFDYYVGRAFHPRSVNSNGAWDALTPWGYYNFPLQQRIETIK